MKKKKTVDAILVLQFQSGNYEALTKLVKRWHKPFCEKAYWIVKDADVAKDIAQDSWGTIINKINHLKNPESFGSWALRIVYTKSLDWINSNKRHRKNLEIYKYGQEHQGIDEEEKGDQVKKLIIEMVRKLPEHQQMIIKLFYVQDYSLKEISSILNISEGTVKSRLFHAREKLKQTLKYRNYEK